LGSRGILRGLLYDLSPFFRIFRNPALFRGIFILCFSLAAGFGFEEILKEDSAGIAIFRRAMIVLIIILGIILGFGAIAELALMGKDEEAAALIKFGFLESLPIQIALLAAFFFWLRSDRKYRAFGILLLASLDLALMVQANISIVGSFLNPQERKEYLADVSMRGLVVTDYNWMGRYDNWAYPSNTGMVFKQFQTSAYNPFRSQDYLKVMDTGLHKVAGKFPRFFMAPAVAVYGNADAALPFIIRAAKLDSMPVIVTENPPSGISIKTDAAYKTENVYPSSIQVVNFSMDRVEIAFKNDAPVLFCTTEGFHRGWVATLDGKQVPTVKIDFAFRGVYALTPGTHQLVWEFNPASFYEGLWVSGLGAIILAGWIVIAIRKRPKNQQREPENAFQ
jgi:hypothetical protein